MRHWMMFLLFCLSNICPNCGMSAEPSTNASDSISLLKEAQLSDPRSASGSPFRLRASITTFEADNKFEKGTYTLLWGAPDQWLEEFSIGDFHQTRLGGDGGIWETRSVPFIPYHLWQLSQALTSFARLSLTHNERVGKIQSKIISGVDLRCVEVTLKNYQYRDLCFAADSDQLVLEHPVIPNRWYYFSRYALVGSHRLPKKIEVYDGQSQTAELVVEELQDSVSLDSLAFEHGVDARWRPWCPNPEPVDHISPIHSREVVGLGLATVYFSIGTDGRIHGAQILKSSNPQRNARILEALKKEKWERPTCNGRPVEIETVAVR